MAGFAAQTWPVPWYSLIYLRATRNLAAVRLEKQCGALRRPLAACAMQAGMSAHSAAEPGLDASDIDAGWDLIGDLREALPDAATNGSCAGACPYPCLPSQPTRHLLRHHLHCLPAYRLSRHLWGQRVCGVRPPVRCLQVVLPWSTAS